MRPLIVFNTCRWGFLAVAVAASLGGLMVGSFSSLAVPSVIDIPDAVVRLVHHYGFLILIVLFVWECIGRSVAIVKKAQGGPEQNDGGSQGTSGNKDGQRQQYSEEKTFFRTPITAVLKDHALEKFTAILVVVGFLQWLTFEKTDETLKAQLRAWVEPQGIVIIRGFKPGETLDYTIVHANVGKEPAIDVVMQGGEKQRFFDIPENGVVSGYFSGKNNWCDIARPNMDGLVIWPAQNKSRGINVFGALPKEIEDFRLGKKFMMIEGCLGYKTVGEERFSSFCFYTRPQMGSTSDQWPILPCMNHNGAN